MQRRAVDPSIRSALHNAGKRRDVGLSATASSGTPALSLFNTDQRSPALAAVSNNNSVFLRVSLCAATYWSYVKCAALYRTFISQLFVRGNNSNDPVVVCRVSGMVVDEGMFTIRYMKCGRIWRVVAHEGGCK